MRPVHFVHEVLCSDVSACDTRAKLTDENTTTDDAQVTCLKCLTALGYELPSKVVPFTRMSIDLRDDGGRVAA